MTSLPRRLAKAAIAAAQVLDPSRLGLAPGTTDAGAIALVAVYRNRHADLMAGLVRQLGPRATVRLWCLDEPAAILERWTVGHGPGSRFVLLNRLIDTVPEPARRDGLIVSDDDYRIRVGDLPRLVALGRALDLDVWQPAHDRTSFANFGFVRRRPAVVARRTGFVEQGPVLVLSPRAQAVMLPLREDIGMGWGVEIEWSRLATEHDLRLGIADAVLIHHLPPVGGYDRDVEAAQLRMLLESARLGSIDDLHQVHAQVGVLAARRAARGSAPR